MPLNVNMENLTALHGDKAGEVFREIADLGGFGKVGEGQGEISPSYAGGLDVYGVLAESNTAHSSKDKERIAELSGVSRKKDVDGFVGGSFNEVDGDGQIIKKHGEK